ncbi:MAG TPA: (d)CMP kinase [Actinomycetota bacterium]|nr:(d)CMP kinase [Actinomycetota bacterium]
MIEKTGPVVAIDGPAGAGKTTLGRRLAEALDLPFITTGVMYRAVARAALDGGVDVEDETTLAELAGGLAFSVSATGAPPELLVAGAPPGEELQASEVEAVVSVVARHPEVREVLRAQQRRLGVPGCVMEGRDIGTVVFPDADVKVFLGADPEERAGRRIVERGAGGSGDLAGALARRDALDATTNPLRPADDAHAVDTTGRTEDEVFDDVLALLQEALG